MYSNLYSGISEAGGHPYTAVKKQKKRKEKTGLPLPAGPVSIKMKKEDIINILKKNDSTVLSFPSRGPWGSSAFRGNCSGYIIAYFLWKYGVRSMAELFAGSGTGSDVCRDMEVAYTGIDLNPNPPRSDIVSMDIMDDSTDLPAGFYNADMVFAHPPYPSIHGIKYAGSMWKGKELADKDIQQMSWDKGMLAVNHAVMRAYSAMPAGSYEVILVGEIRTKGEYHSMFRALALPGILHQTFVKMQHNTMSTGRTYSSNDFAMTAHEMIAVIKKPGGYEISFVMPKKYALDIRNSTSATWKDVVMSVVRECRQPFVTYQYVTDQVRGYEKAKSNSHLEEKIRQTLQRLCRDGLLAKMDTNKWALPATA